MDISGLLESPKIIALVQSISRKGLISDDGKSLTTLGKELLQFLGTKEGKRLVKKPPSSTEFDIWWKEYPGTNQFTYKGKTFVGDRSIKVKRDECRLKFDKILLEGEYTAIELIDALKLEVLQKKEASVKQGVNKLTYMQNSLTYLNQHTYEQFIELVKEGIAIEETPKEFGGTDI